MKRSTERILTTHTGSFARPPDLAQPPVCCGADHPPYAKSLGRTS
jgi:hypothetical protein